jgi:uncharacterized membrane protein YccC
MSIRQNQGKLDPPCSTAMPTLDFFDRRIRPLLRTALSYYVTNGLSAAFGMLLISGGVHLWLGPFAAAAAAVGVVIVIPPDQPAPRRGKFGQLLPAALIGLPLFLGTQLLHGDPLQMGLLLVSATFIAFLGAAWGKRGIPISVSIMFAMIFSMAVPAGGSVAAAWNTSLYCAIGVGLYLIYATSANALLNGRYRVQMLADTLLSLAKLMRTQARQMTAAAADDVGQANPAPLIGDLLRQQAGLADQLQAARNILLESPRTARRQRLASMLMQVLEMRDHLLACELDLDILRSHAGHAALLNALREVLDALTDRIEALADALLLGRRPPMFDSLRPRLAALQWEKKADDDEPGQGFAPSPAMLARALAGRIGHANDTALHLVALARGEADPDLARVRAAWQMFVSPTTWSWLPFAGLWHWDAPPLRHAIRASLAIAAGYAIALALPWGTHEYWILLTIVVVLRGSFAQTVERRNSRVAGTLMGCLLAGALLSAHVSPLMLLAIATLAQGIAHAFAIRRYLVTSVAATVLGLLQAHLLVGATSPTFAAIERIADTLIGVTIAWGISYVLPSWERSQIPSLVKRALAAQARHARLALGLGQLEAVDNEPELAWRLARREAYDSLSALVQSTQQSLSEPRAVRPPLEPLGRFLAHSYQLLGQLTAVKTMLLLRRERLQPAQIRPPLLHAAEAIAATLLKGPLPPAAVETTPAVLPDPFDHDLSPWLLRRLDLAAVIATKLRTDADQVQQSLELEMALKMESTTSKTDKTNKTNKTNKSDS